MDHLGNLLSAMRLSGGVILDAELRGDWSIAAEFTPDACAQFFPVCGSLVSYHFVREGGLWADSGDGKVLRAEEGSILLFPRNHPHRMFSADVPTVDAGDYIMPPEDDGPATLRLGAGGETVRLYCGFMSASSPDTPLLKRLPSIMVLNPTPAQAEWMRASMKIASDGLSPPLVARLAELMFAEALNIYFQQDEAAKRYVAALSDPNLARALDHIHAHCLEELDVETIARAAGLSRTVLGAKFAAALGEPPMRYCSRLRLTRAAEMLENGRLCGDVADAVGFSCEASFTRAFKRQYGQPPASWRRSLASAAPD